MSRKRVLKHLFADFFFSEDTGLFEERWKPTSEMANDQNFISYQKKHMEFLQKLPVKTELVDLRHFNFLLSEELNEWIVANILRVQKEIGIKKLGFLYNAQNMPNMGVKIFIEDTHEGINVDFFDHEETALSWLASQD